VGHVLHLTVAPSDIDELAHVNNAVYVRWVQEAAVAHSRAVGWTVSDYLARRAAFLVRAHEVEYLRPALAGDPIAVETRVVAMSIATADRFTTIRRSGELLARARTHWAFVDLESGRPVRIPPELRERFPLETPDAAAAPRAPKRRSPPWSNPS
jgi:acyl-CoA thioester hydrolase